MDILLREYVIRKEKNFNDYDKNYVEFICNNIIVTKDSITLDCHGLKCDELKYFLEFLDVLQINTQLKLITGYGNNSKKPCMDYYNERLWRCPLKKIVYDYYIHSKRGFLIKEYRTYITIKLRFN